MLKDCFDRSIDYIRISITEDCNLNCIYCQPGESCKSIEGTNRILTVDEVIKIAHGASLLGIKRIRLTGGEPLVREDLGEMIEGISDIKTIEDISLTTNGVLLADKAITLKRAGLNRVNISMDSLNPEVLRRVSRGDIYDKLMNGIEISLKEGLSPVKVNVVLMRGINDKEVDKFLELTRNKPLHVRFIEYMPINDNQRMWQKYYVSLKEIEEKCKHNYNLEEAAGEYGGGPARYFKIKGAQGKVGFISPLSRHFCKDCNRLRVTSYGTIKPCLFTPDEVPLLPYLDKQEDFAKAMVKALKLKPDPGLAASSSQERSMQCLSGKSMSSIGG